MLLKAGFTQEGLARAYLKINGIWRDHLLFGMISPAAASEHRHEDVLGLSRPPDARVARMMAMANDRWMWDATTALEALGAADVALWVWEPERDRLRLTGALAGAGPWPARAGMLRPPPCARWSCRRTAPPAEDILRVAGARLARSPRACACAAARPASGAASGWRRACAPPASSRRETRFAASEQDGLTGLLDRRSFVARARERLADARAPTSWWSPTSTACAG